MNLENQTVTGNNQVTVNDSLNASLMELTIKPTATSVAPNTNELFIYVDKQPQSNPSNERKQYLFDLEDILRIYNSTADEFKQRLEVVNNDIILRSFVERNVSYDETLQQCSILADSEFEELDSFPITLFEGVNYIYTNYSNVDISLIYTKDTLYNKAFLNGSMYYNHKLRNDGEFCLDDIYFKDAFTKTGGDLNLEVNNASVDSLSSNNNAFSLDEQGNLVVNSISFNNANGGSLINDEDVIDLIYPIGSVYISSTNASPSSLFGGTWTLVDKEFTPATFNGNTLFTKNNTNVSAHSFYATRCGHTILLEIGFDTNAQINDTTKSIGNYNLANLGITRFNNSMDLTGFTDGGNCAVFMNISTNGTVSTVDVIPDSYVSTDRYIDGCITAVMTPSFMKDEACNKFYWKRTA